MEKGTWIKRKRDPYSLPQMMFSRGMTVKEVLDANKNHLNDAFNLTGHEEDWDALDIVLLTQKEYDKLISQKRT